MTKLRFTTQETREEPFAPSFYRADQHAARPGAWYVTVAGRDYEVTAALTAGQAEALGTLLDAIATHVASDLGGTIVAAPTPRGEGGGR